MANWTASQRSAIEDDGGALLVSASAGSGKTTVLVPRALRLIAGEIRPPFGRRMEVRYLPGESCPPVE